MINISFWEKIKHFLEIIVNNEFSFIIIGIFIMLAFFVLLSCKMKDNLMKIFYVSTYVLVLGLIIYVYYEQFLSLVDYLIETIVANILFPNLAIYMGVLLLINIIVLVSIFSKKVKDYVKNINIISFAIMQLFLYLIIENVIANNVNVYEKLSIYTNQDLLILVELSMQLFVVWILVLGIIRLIDFLMEKPNVVISVSTSDINLLDGVSHTNSLKVIERNVLIDEINDDVQKDGNNINDYLYVEPIKEIDYYQDYYEFIEYVPIKKVKKNVE